MQLTLNGRNIDITDAIRDYVNEKFSKIEKHYDQPIKIKVILNVNKNPSVKKNCISEAVCFINGSVIKIKEEAESMYASIDLLVDRLDRQVRDLKKKLIKNNSSGKSIRTNDLEPTEEEIEEEEIEEEMLKEPVNIELESDIG